MLLLQPNNILTEASATFLRMWHSVVLTAPTCASYEKGLLKQHISSIIKHSYKYYGCNMLRKQSSSGNKSRFMKDAETMKPNLSHIYQHKSQNESRWSGRCIVKTYTAQRYKADPRYHCSAQVM